MERRVGKRKELSNMNQYEKAEIVARCVAHLAWQAWLPGARGGGVHRPGAHGGADELCTMPRVHAH